jgi:hypothetical protein
MQRLASRPPRELIATTGFDTQVVAEASLVRDDWNVDYFTFRLSP